MALTHRFGLISIKSVSLSFGSLFHCVRLPLFPCSSKLPVGPQSCWTPCNRTGRLICQKRSKLLSAEVPSPISLSLQRHSFSLLHLKTNQIPLGLVKTGLLRRELFRLRCHSHILIFSSFLYRIKQKSSCSSTCGLLSSTTGYNSPPSGLSCIQASPVHHFFTTFIFDLSPDLGVWPDY